MLEVKNQNFCHFVHSVIASLRSLRLLTLRLYDPTTLRPYTFLLLTSFLSAYHLINLLPVFSEELSLEDAMEMAEKNNPEIKALKEKTIALKQKAYSALSPKPLTLEVMRSEMGTFWEAKQNLNFPERYYEYKSIDFQRKALEQAYREKVNSIHINVIKNFYDLAYLKKHLDALREIRKILSLLLDVSKAQYLKDKTISLTLAAAVEVKLTENEIETISALLEAQKFRFAREVLNSTGTYETNFQEEEIPELNSFEEYKKDIFETAPDFQRWQETLASAKSEVQLAKVGLFPDYDLMVREERSDRMWGAMFTFPLFYNRNISALKEKKREFKSLSYEYEQFINKYESDLYEFYQRTISLKKIYENYKTIVSDSKKIVEVNGSRFLTGKMDFEDYMQSIKELKEREIAFIRVENEFLLRAIALKQACCFGLESLKMVGEVRH